MKYCSHEWSKLSKPYYSDPPAKSSWFQNRTCSECNKVEARYIGPMPQDADAEIPGKFLDDVQPSEIRDLLIQIRDRLPMHWWQYDTPPAYTVKSGWSYTYGENTDDSP